MRAVRIKKTDNTEAPTSSDVSDRSGVDFKVYITGRRNLTPLLSKLLKRRAAIEPVIGHTKQDHGMNRNYLLGKVGDRINAMLSASAWNLKNSGAIMSHIHYQYLRPDFFRDDYLIHGFEKGILSAALT